MRLSKERTVSIVVVIANGVLGVTIGDFFSNPLWDAVFAVVVSLPGLIVIWNKRALASIDLTRGLHRDTPPSLLDLIGWFFLLVMPVLYVFQLSST